MSGTMNTLIGVQEAALTRLAEPRSSAKRHARFRGVVRREYAERLSMLGFDEPAIRATWRDVVDMFELQAVVDES